MDYLPRSVSRLLQIEAYCLAPAGSRLPAKTATSWQYLIGSPHYPRDLGRNRTMFLILQRKGKTSQLRREVTGLAIYGSKWQKWHVDPRGSFDSNKISLRYLFTWRITFFFSTLFVFISASHLLNMQPFSENPTSLISSTNGIEVTPSHSQTYIFSLNVSCKLWTLISTYLAGYHHHLHLNLSKI